MDATIAARAIHVLAIVHWIGGVAFVTLVMLPAIRKTVTPRDRLARFEEIEGRFSVQAKLSVLIAGLSGFYMVESLGAWPNYLDAGYWWLHAMTAVWAVFMLVLYVIEPFFLAARLKTRAAADPEGVFRFLQRAHYLLLAVSLATVGGAVLGAHGVLF